MEEIKSVNQKLKKVETSASQLIKKCQNITESVANFGSSKEREEKWNTDVAFVSAVACIGFCCLGFAALLPAVELLVADAAVPTLVCAVGFGYIANQANELADKCQDIVKDVGKQQFEVHPRSSSVSRQYTQRLMLRTARTVHGIGQRGD
eukprot:s548_g21.t1